MAKTYLLSLLAGALLLVPSAVAQGYAPNASTVYDLRVLVERPGIVYVSPKYLTVIEFTDLIDEIGTSQPGLLQVRVSDAENVIFLKALKQAGSADLVVRIGGHTALFRVVVDPRMESPRRYVVTTPSARPTLAPQGGNLPSPTTPGEGGLRGQDGGGAGKGGGNKAPEARFEAMRSGSGWLVYYEIHNPFPTPLSLRMSDLVVLRGGGTPIAFRLVRTSFGEDPEVLPPSKAASGMILVDDAPEGITWQWTLYSGKDSYTLRGRAP